jgi:hypothetical protein
MEFCRNVHYVTWVLPLLGYPVPPSFVNRLVHKSGRTICAVYYFMSFPKREELSTLRQVYYLCVKYATQVLERFIKLIKHSGRSIH